VVVNLAGAGFVDGGGMSTLFEAAGWALAQGSRLYLAGCSAQLVRLLHVADLYAG
jgi:hypothetical protein